MSRNTIVAATITLAAFGLGFAGYLQATRANSDGPQANFGQQADIAENNFRMNHQAGKGSTEFEQKMPNWRASRTANGSAATALLTSTPEEPKIGQCYDTEDDPRDEPAPGSGTAAREDAGAAIQPPGSYATDNNSFAGGSWSFGGNAISRGAWSGGGSASGGSSSSGGSGHPGSDGTQHDDSSHDPIAPQGNNQGDNANDNAHSGDTTHHNEADSPPHNNAGGNSPELPNTPNGGPAVDPPKGDAPKDQSTPPGTGSHEPEGSTLPPTDHHDDYTDPGRDIPPSDPQHEVHSVPEPGTLGLIACGLAALGMRRRRRS
jgi:hypothetical protein